jgi:hypothetical protein
MGKPLKVQYDSGAKKITIQAPLQRGANALALRVPGRKTTWLLIGDR